MKLIIDIVNHIENNLENEISVEYISRFSGYSPHHFQKMFAACVGVSLGTYIRRRRLTRPSIKLVSSNEKIINIAIASGFDSQEAFTRAFKLMFGTTPKDYRKRKFPESLRNQYQINYKYVQHLKYEGVTMEPIFESKNEFYVIGLGQNFERGKTQDIGKKLWPEFSKRFDEIPNKKGGVGNDYVTYGICQEIWVDDKIQDQFNYFAAVEVDKNTTPPDGMTLIKIEKQNYAIFTHKGGLSTLDHTNQYIWGTWLPQSGYELAQASDIEVYPANFQASDCKANFEIWVPLDTKK